MTKQQEYLKELARLALIVAADELNEDFGLEPPINTSDDAPTEELIDLMQKASVMYDPEMDTELSEFTTIVINLTLKYKEA